MSRSRTLRVIAVIGLLSAAVFIALPLFGCSWNPVKHTVDPSALLGICTFGFPGEDVPPRLGLPGFKGPYWGNLVVGIAYLVAAAYVAVSKRF